MLPVQKVDSVRFTRTSLDLIAGGAPESMTATVYPLLANPAFDLSVADRTLARVEGNLVFGLKEGETTLMARSSEDPSQSTSIPLAVFPAENVESVRLTQDSVVLYLGGESQTLTATIHPATLQARFLWKSADPKIVEVDPQGKITPQGAGKAYVSATARADARRSDSALVIVRRDSPRLTVGSDTVVSAGSTVTYRISVSQEYGTVVQFKADLDGDGTFEDSSATVPASKSYPYTAVKEYAVRFYVRDSEGNETTVTRKVSAVTGRVVQITSPKDGAYVNQTPITITWIVDGVSQTNSQPLTPGENTVVREATDPAGKVFSHSIKVHLDQTAPNRPVVKGSAVPVGTLTPTWTWVSGGGGGSGTFRYRIDNPAVDGGVTTTDTFHTAATNLSEGAHTLYVQERDEAGNWSPSGSAQIRIDTAAPAAPTVTVTPSGVTNNRRPAWAWTGGVGDTYRYYRYKFGNDDFRSGARDTVGTSFRPSVDLDEGPHTLFVQVRDSAGNWSAAGSATVTLDLVAPGAPTVSGPALTNDATPTWTWSTSTAGMVTFRYRLDNADLSTGATTTTEKAFTPASNLSEGVHTLYVQESDAAGNWSASGSRQIRIDVTPPAAPRIDSTPFSPLNTLRPRWTWRSGGGGIKIFRARLDNPVLEGASEQADSSFTPSTNLPEGRHILYVQERDSAGNWSAMSSRGLVVLTKGALGGEGALLLDNDRMSLIFDRSGSPMLAFSERGQGIRIRKFDGRVWNALGSVVSSVGTHVKMSLNDEGEPFIAFRSEEELYRGINVRHRRGAVWEHVGGILPLSNGYSLGLVASRDPFVAIGIPGDSARIEVFSPSGSSWSPVGHPLSEGTQSYPTLAVSPNDVPMVAFMDGSVNRRLTVKQWVGGAWTTLGQAGFSRGAVDEPRIRISKSGTPFVLFTEYVGGSQRVSVARYFNGGWHYLQEGFFKSAMVWDLDLSIDDAGRPVIAFEDDGGDERGRPQLFMFTGESWRPLGKVQIEYLGASSLSLAIDSLGVPHLAYRSSFSDMDSRATIYRVGFDP